MSTSVACAKCSEWEEIILSRLPLYGHRNWIVVADSAYPAQSHPGIETVPTACDQVHVLQKVVAAITASPHVKANVYTDQELRFVQEEAARGIGEYHRQIAELLPKVCVRELPHEDIIAKLDQAAQMFRVLILKTSLAIPYTSVFFELDCAYWNAAAEEDLRSAIQKASNAK